MFDHVGIRVSDLAVSERFYTTVLGVLGLEQYKDELYTEWGDFAIGTDGPVTRRLHIAFFAPTTDLVDAFHRAGIEAGYPDGGAPGPRKQYRPDYYGAFLLDPDGNSVEAVKLDKDSAAGTIDHLWLRTSDLGAARAFYSAIAPYTGFALADDEPERVQFKGGSGSFSFVKGDAPTENVHMAWPGPSDDAVDAFHAAAVEAGYRSNGAPGERAIYHPGYYGAFILDPDGHNVEVVNHNR